MLCRAALRSCRQPAANLLHDLPRAQPDARQVACAVGLPAAQRRRDVLTRAAERFGETRLAEALHCSRENIATALRGWQPDGASYLPGIGLCSREIVQEIRGWLAAGPERRAA